MKICYVNPTLLIRRPIAELIGRLGDSHKTAILVPKKPFSKVDKSWHSNENLRKAKIYSYSAVNIPFINFEWPIPITPMFFINLFRVFWNYDVIHMWTYFYINSIFTLFFSLFFRKKLIMTCDTFPGYSFKSGEFIDGLFFIYTKLFGWFIFSVPNKIQIYGRSMLKFALRAGVRNKKIVILPTGINLDKFKQGKSIRKELIIGEKEMVLVYAGLIVPRKGIGVMLRVVKNLQDKNIKLLLVGEGPNKKDYIKMAKRLGIIDQVRFFGWRKDIPSILKSSDILILPTKGEGLPGIVMEAMATGLPIVASDIPGVKDLIEDSRNGFLCKINDIECFTSKIKELIKYSWLRKKFSFGGKQKIREFDWDNLIRKYIGVYK